MRPRHRSTKSESSALEFLINQFAREIQVLASPEAAPAFDKDAEGAASDEEQKGSSSLKTVSAAPQPAVKAAEAAVPEGAEPAVPADEPQGKFEDPPLTLDFPVKQELPTSAAEVLSAGEDMPSSASLDVDSSETKAPSPTVARKHEPPSRTISSRPAEAGKGPAVQVKKDQSGSWSIVVGPSPGGRTSWNRHRVPLFALLALVGSLALGWIVATLLGGP